MNTFDIYQYVYKTVYSYKRKWDKLKKGLLLFILFFMFHKALARPSLKHYAGYNGIVLLYRPWEGMSFSTSYFYNWSRNSGASLGLMLRPKDMEEEFSFEDNFTVVAQGKIFFNFFDIAEYLYLIGCLGGSLGIKIIDIEIEGELDFMLISWLSIFMRTGLGVPLWEKLGTIYFNIDIGVKLCIDLF